MGDKDELENDLDQDLEVHEELAAQSNESDDAGETSVDDEAGEKETVAKADDLTEGEEIDALPVLKDIAKSLTDVFEEIGKITGEVAELRAENKVLRNQNALIAKGMGQFVEGQMTVAKSVAEIKTDVRESTVRFPTSRTRPAKPVPAVQPTVTLENDYEVIINKAADSYDLFQGSEVLKLESILKDPQLSTPQRNAVLADNFDSEQLKAVGLNAVFGN